jgi:hypothetical protein
MGRAGFSLGYDGELDGERRQLLTGLTAACLTALVAPAAAQVAAHPGEDAFFAASKFLTGRSSLDRMQGARLFDALTASTPRFETDVRALLAFIEDRKLEPERLQQALDAESSPISAVPGKIMTAWYSGIVGEGGSARCIAFETSLMYQAVADRLKPPSYCYGPPGSWSRKPGEEA